MGKLFCAFHFHNWGDSIVEGPLMCIRCGTGNFKTFSEGIGRMQMRGIFMGLVILFAIGLAAVWQRL